MVTDERLNRLGWFCIGSGVMAIGSAIDHGNSTVGLGGLIALVSGALLAALTTEQPR